MQWFFVKVRLHACNNSRPLSIQTLRILKYVTVYILKFQFRAIHKIQYDVGHLPGIELYLDCSSLTSPREYTEINWGANLRETQKKFALESSSSQGGGANFEL